MGNNIRSKGYSVIEIIIYFAACSIISVAVLNMTLHFVKNYKTDGNNVEFCNDIGFALSRMSSEIRNADTVTIPEPYEHNTLKITIKQKNKYGMEETKTIKYYVNTNSNKLYRMTGGISNILSENVADIIFSWYNAENTVLKITAVPKNEEGFTVSTLVYTRIGSK